MGLGTRGGAMLPRLVLAMLGTCGALPANTLTADTAQVLTEPETAALDQVLAAAEALEMEADRDEENEWDVFLDDTARPPQPSPSAEHRTAFYVSREADALVVGVEPRRRRARAWPCAPRWQGRGSGG